MEFFKSRTNINFLGISKPALAFSILLMILSIGSLATRGLNFGIDFTGGVLIEVGYPDQVELESVRDVLSQAGFDGAIVQHFGALNDVLIRL